MLDLSAVLHHQTGYFLFPLAGAGCKTNNNREGVMKITRDNTLVELVPENPSEAQQLNELWRVVVDCEKFNKKLVPVGEYIPGEKEIARFNIED